jgi:hypothetical protein
MSPPTDPDDAVRTVERVLDMVDGWTDLDEFKRTRRAR